MAKSNAERQRAYRQRHLHSDEGLLTRVQVYLCPHAERSLRDLAAQWQCTKREVLERLLIAADPLLQRNDDTAKALGKPKAKH